MNCKVCGGNIINCLSGTERLLGLGGKFTYGFCDECGSLQLIDKVDEGRFYPPDYYSFNFDYNNPNPTDNHIFGATDLISEFKMTEETSILDWGAGSVSFLYALYKHGVGKDGELNKLRAYDPYTTPNQTKEGIKIQSYIPTDMQFDYVQFRHSLEHVDDPVSEVKKAVSCLKPGGTLIITTPNTASMCYERFRQYWYQLDAPRHKVLFNPLAITMLTEKAQLINVSLKCVASFQSLYYSGKFSEGLTYKQASEELIKIMGKKEIADLMIIANYLNGIMYGDSLMLVAKKGN